MNSVPLCYVDQNWSRSGTQYGEVVCLIFGPRIDCIARRVKMEQKEQVREETPFNQCIPFVDMKTVHSADGSRQFVLLTIGEGGDQ